MSRILPTPPVFISGYANTENIFYCLIIRIRRLGENGGQWKLGVGTVGRSSSAVQHKTAQTIIIHILNWEILGVTLLSSSQFLWKGLSLEGLESPWFVRSLAVSSASSCSSQPSEGSSSLSEAALEVNDQDVPVFSSGEFQQSAAHRRS